MAGQTIVHDDRVVISELAFGRYAMVSPHSNPANDSVFIVISGGGYVQVGDERARVNHGEAVLWPADVVHGAYTDGTEMRAIVVELIGAAGSPVVEAPSVSESDEPAPLPPTPAQGGLAERQVKRDEYDSSEGEPW